MGYILRTVHRQYSYVIGILGLTIFGISSIFFIYTMKTSCAIPTTSITKPVSLHDVQKMTTPQLQFVTVSTKGSTGESDRIQRMKLVAGFYGLKYTILGLSEPWGGWHWMVQMLILPFLRELPDNTMVVVLDATDTMVQCTQKQVWDNYLRVVNDRTPGTVVLGLESMCPRKDGCADVVNEHETFQKTGVPGLRHINGGFVMGPVRAVIDLWESVGHQDPQVAIGLYAAAYPHFVSIDTHQHLIANIVNIDGNHNEFSDYFQLLQNYGKTHWIGGKTYTVDSRVINVKSGNQPCFMHFPGTPEKNRNRGYHKARFTDFDRVVHALTPKTTAHNEQNWITSQQIGFFVQVYDEDENHMASVLNGIRRFYPRSPITIACDHGPGNYSLLCTMFQPCTYVVSEFRINNERRRPPFNYTCAAWMPRLISSIHNMDVAYVFVWERGTRALGYLKHAPTHDVMQMLNHRNRLSKWTNLQSRITTWFPNQLDNNIQGWSTAGGTLINAKKLMGCGQTGFYKQERWNELVAIWDKVDSASDTCLFASALLAGMSIGEWKEYSELDMCKSTHPTCTLCIKSCQTDVAAKMFGVQEIIQMQNSSRIDWCIITKCMAPKCPAILQNVKK